MDKHCFNCGKYAVIGIEEWTKSGIVFVCSNCAYKDFKETRIESEKPTQDVMPDWVIKQALSIVEERGKRYGSPSGIFKDIAALQSTEENFKTAQDVVIDMILMKVARYRRNPTKEWDSILDIVGYAGCLGSLYIEYGGKVPEDDR